MVQHLIQCERCYFAISESMRLSGESRDHGIRRSRWLWSGLAASAAALLLSTLVFKSPANRDLVHGEQATVSHERASEQGGQRVSVPTLSEQATSTTVRDVVGAVRDEPIDVATKNRSSVQARAEDVQSLLLALTRAGSNAGFADLGNPRAQNQLAETYLARWHETERLEDAVFAFEAARLASTGDPQFLEARYNLGWALEAMSTSMQKNARHVWEECLAVDSTSHHAQEVKRHLSRKKNTADSSELAGIGRPASMKPELGRIRR